MGAFDAAALCVAGVALGDIHHPFAWPAWHLATSTFVSLGRRGTCTHQPSFRKAGVALGHAPKCSCVAVAALHEDRYT